MKRAIILLLILGTTRLAGAQEMLRVKGGLARIGSAQGDADERPVHSVTLKPFMIDHQEVTQSFYGLCVAAGACGLPRRYPRHVAPHMPVVGVTWHQAREYCRWVGKRLPSEAEWERAARGPLGRTYPWGEELVCRRANFGNYQGAGFCAGVNPGQVAAVGTRARGRTPEGIEDLGGNVWEWVADDYTPYPKARDGRPSRARGKAPRLKVLRGGSCCSYFVMPRGANRLAFPASYRDRDMGFRCAQDLKKWTNSKRRPRLERREATPTKPQPIDLPRRSP